MEKPLCPACCRPFTGMLDYPNITVLGIEFPPQGIISEDTQTWNATSFDEVKRIWMGISSPDAVQKYLAVLKNYSIQSLVQAPTIPPKDLLPTWKNENSYFQWAYMIPRSDLSEASLERFILPRYYLAPSETSLGVCQIHLLGPGPNLGSAGGPTITVIGTIATIIYRGNIKT